MFATAAGWPRMRKNCPPQQFDFLLDLKIGLSAAGIYGKGQRGQCLLGNIRFVGDRETSGGSSQADVFAVERPPLDRRPNQA
jgi:hypothetical protein